jgi:BirA family biotin operon repressor/biotin-[acetyl-CoA-carboxylase] ligase
VDAPALATFDRTRFRAALATRWIGHELIARAAADSTNDIAWDALAAGAPDGTTVIADAQTRGRGREGRVWHTAPGLGLAMSVLLRPGCERHALTVLPLAAGLALARALDTLGARPELKWPNDVLLSGRKVSGILSESRRGPDGDDAVVVGCGVNVLQSRDDFPPGVRDLATSLALEGVTTDRETVAARLLNALEPLWTELDEAGTEAIVEAWRARATFWGRPLTVRTPAGEVTGTALGLAEDGALLLESKGGGTIRIVAGDVAPR